MNFPTLRFEGFEGQWREFSFNQIANITMGQSPSGDSYNTFQQGEPLINGPTEFGNIYPTPIQWTTKPTKYSKSGDVLLCVRGSSIGRMNISDQKYCIGRGVAAISGLDNKTTSIYLKFVLEKEVEKILKRSTGSTFPNISGHELKQSLVSIPKLQEQQKIAFFFSSLDLKIEKQLEKIEKLGHLKTGMMQKIFSQELRFKDEDGREFPEWEEKPLCDITKRIVRKNKGLQSTRPLTISAQHGLVDQKEYFNKNVASSNIEGYYLLEKGEFAYNKSYSRGYPLGAIKRLNDYDNGVLSTLYICFEPLMNISSDFLSLYFDSTFWHEEVSIISVEGARNHGLLNVGVNDFFNTKHKIPCLEEQIKISTTLMQFNLKIKKEKEKLSSLSQLKKGFMQQMFV